MLFKLRQIHIISKIRSLVRIWMKRLPIPHQGGSDCQDETLFGVDLKQPLVRTLVSKCKNTCTWEHRKINFLLLYLHWVRYFLIKMHHGWETIELSIMPISFVVHFLICIPGQSVLDRLWNIPGFLRGAMKHLCHLCSGTWNISRDRTKQFGIFCCGVRHIFSRNNKNIPTGYVG